MTTKPSSCVGCPLEKEGKGFVPGDGPLSAEVWLWLQAPGEVEAKQGKPVVGPAGQLLWRIMASLKKDRSEFRIENTVRCQPPKKNGQDFIPAGAVEHCTKNHSPLHSGQTAPPKIIIAMGNEALNLFTGKRDIEKWRGSLHQGSDLDGNPCVGKAPHLDPSCVYKSGARKGQPREVRLPVHIPQAAKAIMPTYHPSALKKGAMHLTPVVMKDIKTALEFAAGNWSRPSLNYKFVKFPHELQDWDKKDRTHMSVAVDIETACDCPLGHQGKELSECRNQKMVLVSLSDGGPTVVFAPESHMLPELAQILATREMMAHNGISFDFPRLAALLKAQNPMMRSQILGGIDTMLGWSLCEPDLHKRLSYAAACVKNDTFFWKEDKDFIRYNARDSERCWHVGDYVAKELKRTGQMDFFLKIMQPAYDRLAQATLHGIRKDEAAASQMEKDLEADRALLLQSIPPDLEWSKPAKVAAWLTANGVKPWGADNKGGPASQAALHKAKIENPKLAPTIDAVLSLRNIQKTISTYLHIKTDDNGLLHPHFLPGDGEKEAEQGTATQRVSCRDPNIQNVPPEVRKIFVPTHTMPSGGWSILTADFVQIEWRLTCYFANHMEAAKGDIHKRFAANLLGKAEDLVTDAERKTCKAFVYGKIYGMGKRTMREWLLKEQEILMPESDCERHLREVTKYMPWLDALQRETTKEAIRQGYIANPYGVRRYFYSEDDARKALNTKIQGTAACMLLEVLAKLPTQEFQSLLWATVHDELDFEVRTSNLALTSKALKTIITKPNPRLGGFSIEPKFTVGPSWGELTDYAA